MHATDFYAINLKMMKEAQYKKTLALILALILVFSMIPFAVSAVEHYMIWVGSTEVTSDNRHDILNDGGKAQYDPRTNTLTPDEPVISEPYFSDDLRENCCIYANPINDEDLVITGSYHMDNQIAWLSQVGLAVDYGGEVATVDATHIQRHLAGLPTPTLHEAAADVDKDNEIDIIDVTHIQRHLANIPTKSHVGKKLR